MSIADERITYHTRVLTDIVRLKSSEKKGDYHNFADGDSTGSVSIAREIITEIAKPIGTGNISGQTVGKRFELATKDFIESVFGKMQHLRPGDWIYTTDNTEISGFDQYSHLAGLVEIVKGDTTLKSALGQDYLVKPDIIVARRKTADAHINANEQLTDIDGKLARNTSLREANYDQPTPILHASISCKWTIRSDRAQNTRTEALNLVRNRKGNLPHVTAVTAEPLPTRIAALALGTGDLDCVYHFALYELVNAVQKLKNEDQLDILIPMIEGRRLRDISDLPFDLAV